MKRLLFSISCLLAAACYTNHDKTGAQPGIDSGMLPDGAVRPAACAVEGRAYSGLSGRDLTAVRKETIDAPLLATRMRVKPIDAIRGEFLRVFGFVPQLLLNGDALLGVPTPRWDREPMTSSFALLALYRSGFQACGKYVDAHQAWLAAADNTSRSAACQQMLSEMWERTPTNEQAAACADIASGASLPDTPAGRGASTKIRWQHACAKAVTAPDFLTYGATP